MECRETIEDIADTVQWKYSNAVISLQYRYPVAYRISYNPASVDHLLGCSTDEEWLLGTMKKCQFITRHRTQCLSSNFE